jgi:hypothetical protein
VQRLLVAVSSQSWRTRGWGRGCCWSSNSSKAGLNQQPLHHPPWPSLVAMTPCPGHAWTPSCVCVAWQTLSSSCWRVLHPTSTEERAQAAAWPLDVCVPLGGGCSCTACMSVSISPSLCRAQAVWCYRRCVQAHAPIIRTVLGMGCCDALDLIKCPHKQHQVSQHPVWLIVTLQVCQAKVGEPWSNAGAPS